MTLTQAYLKEILEYNPKNGIFVWKRNMPPRGKVGNVAGFANGNGYIRMSINNEKYR